MHNDFIEVNGHMNGTGYVIVLVLELDNKLNNQNNGKVKGVGRGGKNRALSKLEESSGELTIVRFVQYNQTHSI